MLCVSGNEENREEQPERGRNTGRQCGKVGMERYAEANGETSEAVTGDEIHTAGDFFIKETAFRDNGIFQRKSAEILRGQN